MLFVCDVDSTGRVIEGRIHEGNTFYSFKLQFRLAMPAARTDLKSMASGVGEEGVGDHGTMGGRRRRRRRRVHDVDGRNGRRRKISARKVSIVSSA